MLSKRAYKRMYRQLHGRGPSIPWRILYDAYKQSTIYKPELALWFWMEK